MENWFLAFADGSWCWGTPAPWPRWCVISSDPRICSSGLSTRMMPCSDTKKGHVPSLGQALHQLLQIKESIKYKHGDQKKKKTNSAWVRDTPTDHYKWNAGQQGQWSRCVQKLEFPMDYNRGCWVPHHWHITNPRLPEVGSEYCYFQQLPKAPWGMDILFRSREAGNYGYHVKYPSKLLCLLHQTAGTMLSQNQGIWLISKCTSMTKILQSL